MDTFALSSLNQWNRLSSQQMAEAKAQQLPRLVARFRDTSVAVAGWLDSTSRQPAAVKRQSQSTDYPSVCGGHRRNNVANEKSREEGRKEAGSCPWTHGPMDQWTHFLTFRWGWPWLVHLCVIPSIQCFPCSILKHGYNKQPRLLFPAWSRSCFKLKLAPLLPPSWLM